MAGVSDDEEAWRRRQELALQDLAGEGWSADDLAKLRSGLDARARTDDKEYRRQLRLVRDALAAAGVDEPDLLRTTEDPTRAGAAIPVLLGLLDRVADLRLKEAIVRALTTRHARPVAADRLLREFREASDETYAWAVGNALTAVVTADHFDELTRLAYDAGKGRSREMLPEAIAATKHPRAVDALLGLLVDDQVAGHAVHALRHRWLRDDRVPSAVAAFRTHPKPWVRSAAKKVLAKYGED